MIVDATCAPSNIRYPQDVSQLNEARENAETLLDVLHDPADGKKPRTYRKRARKDYLKYTRCRKHTAKMTRKAIGKQLAYLRRDLDAIDGKLSLGKNLPSHQAERLGTIRAVYEQQKYMYDNRTHSVPDRIVSVSQPFVRPIVREKAGKPVEFGAKLDISVVDGWTRLECCSFDAYNEAGNLREMAERFRAREGHYPSRILADKIYRNRENLSYCKAHGIRLLVLIGGGELLASLSPMHLYILPVVRLNKPRAFSAQLFNNDFLRMSNVFIAHLLSNTGKFRNLIRAILRSIIVFAGLDKSGSQVRIMLFMNYKIWNSGFNL